LTVFGVLCIDLLSICHVFCTKLVLYNHFLLFGKCFGIYCEILMSIFHLYLHITIKKRAGFSPLLYVSCVEYDA